MCGTQPNLWDREPPLSSTLAEKRYIFLFFLLPLTCSTIHSLNPARGMPWMPNLGSPLHRTWSCQGLSILRPGLGQTVALHALPTVRSCAFLIITFPFHSSFFFFFFSEILSKITWSVTWNVVSSKSDFCLWFRCIEVCPEVTFGAVWVLSIKNQSMAE